MTFTASYIENVVAAGAPGVSLQIRYDPLTFRGEFRCDP